MDIIRLTGSTRYRLKTAAMLGRTTASVCLRRLLRGRRNASWNFMTELSTEIARRQLMQALSMNNVQEARGYLDSFVVESRATASVNVTPVVQPNFKGSWIAPKQGSAELVVLYLHGGGYSFYPRGFYDNLGAMLAIAANAKIFALDYRLTPEHRFPAQLNDAVACYEWLIGTGVAPERLVVIGDSAGGNLTLALLLSLRDSNRTLPALAVCLSPATDFAPTAIELSKAEMDWITPQMAVQWADWFCAPEERSNPLVSPVNADLKGLPPIYIQAGGNELLLPGIQMFVERAKQQDADVTLEVWPEMNHDFQAFGFDARQSADALRRISEVIAQRIPREAEKTNSAL